MKKWKIGFPYGNLHTKIVDEDGWPVAAVWMKKVTGSGDAEPWPEGEDNLNLILAAPKMKRALEDAAKRLDFLTNWLENTYGGSEKDIELGRSYARTARAALEGES